MENYNENISGHNKNKDIIIRPKKSKKKKKKKKKKLGYLYLFIIAFLAGLSSLSYLVKSYSPDVDVVIGNKEDSTLTYSDSEYEIKPIDERLKWIQMEDDMPSVSVKKDENEDYSYLFDKPDNKKEFKSPRKEVEEETKELKQPPKPVSNKIVQTSPLKLNENITVPKKQPEKSVPEITITKVYTGKYNSLDEAIEVQQKISAMGMGVSPFVKSVNGYYIVQVGSFYDPQKAEDLVSTLKSKGFSAKKELMK